MIKEDPSPKEIVLYIVVAYLVLVCGFMGGPLIKWLLGDFK